MPMNFVNNNISISYADASKSAQKVAYVFENGFMLNLRTE